MRLLQSVRPQTLRVGALAVVLVLTVLFFAAQIDNYLSARTINRILTSAALILPIAVGQALVVMTRNIDLSVGSVVGLTAYMVGDFLGSHDIGPVAAFAMAMGIGAAFGAVNGLLVAYGRVPSIIVTLGTLALFRSFLVEYSDAKTITTGSLPQWTVDLPGMTLFTVAGLQVRLLVVIALVAAIIVGVALRRLRAARRLYAVGSNPEAAVMAGINAPRVVLTAFVLSGMLAGLAGMIFLSRFGTITVVAGLGFELKSVAAVVVGGVNIFGGSGTITGVVLGTVLIDTLENSLLRWQVISEFWRDALLGMLIILAVAADSLMGRYFARVQARRAEREARR